MMKSARSIDRLVVAALMLATLPSAAAAFTSWVSGTPTPTANSQQAAATIDGTIYMVGGYNTGVLANLYAYNPLTAVWTSKSPMPQPRYDGDGAGVINGKLYVAGGWTPVSPGLPHNDLFIYNPATDSWSSGASLSHLSGCGATGVINGKLYVYSPCNGYSGYAQTLDVYDPPTNAWTNLASSSAQHANPAWAVINSKLYVAGGTTVSGASNVLEVYDPVTNSWTTLAHMGVAVSGAFSYATVDGKLLVLGGTNAKGVAVTNGQIYDPVTNKWSTSKALFAPLSAGAGAVDYGFYFVLGGVASGAPSTTNELVTATPILP